MNPEIVKLRKTIDDMRQAHNANSQTLQRQIDRGRTLENFVFFSLLPSLFQGEARRQAVAEWNYAWHQYNTARILETCNATPLLDWSLTNKTPEAVGLLQEEPDGQWVIMVEVHPLSPLAAEWDGVTRIGDDKGKVIRSVADKLRAEKGRIADQYPAEIVDAHIAPDDGRQRLVLP